MSRLYSDNCDYCKHCYDRENWSCDIEEPCINGNMFEPKNKTNADRIRHMSDEELADYIFGVSVHEKPCVLCSDDCDFCELTDEECKNRTLKWLHSEVEE